MRKRCNPGNYECTGSKGSSCMSVDKTCRAKPGTIGQATLAKVGNLAKQAAHLGEHVGENVISWGVGRVVGGAISHLATAHGIDPGIARVVSEAGVQALTATALHARKKEHRSPSELASKFISEVAGATVGKFAHSGVDDAIMGGDEDVKRFAALLAGKGGGAVATTTAAGMLEAQGKALKGLVDRFKQRRDHMDTGIDIQLTQEEQEALFWLALAGYLVGVIDSKSS